MPTIIQAGLPPPPKAGVKSFGAPKPILDEKAAARQQEVGDRKGFFVLENESYYMTLDIVYKNHLCRRTVVWLTRRSVWSACA
jgi:hypothetical protein